MFVVDRVEKSVCGGRHLGFSQGSLARNQVGEAGRVAVRGLRNFGNTCYLNAILQVLWGWEFELRSEKDTLQKDMAKLRSSILGEDEKKTILRCSAS